MLIQEFGTRGIAKLLEYAGIDFVTIDMEHSAFGIERVADLLAWFKATPITPIVRVPARDPHFISAVLDAGSAGVQVANVESAEEARAVVTAAKYPPAGERGLGLIASHTDFRPVESAKYVLEANRGTMVVVQIESKAGLDNIEAIAAVDGVDVLSIGFGDLSHSLGIAGQLDHPLFREAAQAVAAACNRHNKIAKIHPHSDEQTRRYVAMGYRMLMCPIDVAIFRRGAKSAVDGLRGVIAAAKTPSRGG
jgi:2-dehydro-3-deoxyglucarate aldolase/4-hydroxy-2-oxoheptanedioate aldolase